MQLVVLAAVFRPAAWRALAAGASARHLSASGASCPRSRVIYDGGCPLCSREIAILRKANERSDALEFCDITRPEEFDPVARRHNISRDQAMAQLHVIGKDGQVYKGVEAFRHMYSATGWDGLVEMTKIPSVNRLLTTSYAWFARHRTKLQNLGGKK